jgi:DNA-binding MarR family transcriptional regulator
MPKSNAILIALKSVALSDELSGTEKRVLVTILDHFNHKTGQCDPSITTLAALLQVHSRTVVRSTKAIVKKGFLLNHRHGGKFHRNQYELIWTKFEQCEAAWKNRRRDRRALRSHLNMSPKQGQPCRSARDADVTQTCPLNHSHLTSDAPHALPKQDLFVPVDRHVGSAKKESNKIQERAEPAAFHLNRGYRIALDAAERRWNSTLMQKYLGRGDLYEKIAEALDDSTKSAATAAEVNAPGSGLDLIERTLDALLRGKGI